MLRWERGTPFSGPLLSGDQSIAMLCQLGSLALQKLFLGKLF